MPPCHWIELLPDQTGDAAVRRDWKCLSEAGLPSQADHQGSTNAPHVTAIAVPAISGENEALAVELLGPLLPIEGALSGMAIFGQSHQVLARLVEVPDEVVAAVLALRSPPRDTSIQGGCHMSPLLTECRGGSSSARSTHSRWRLSRSG